MRLKRYKDIRKILQESGIVNRLKMYGILGSSKARLTVLVCKLRSGRLVGCFSPSEFSYMVGRKGVDELSDLTSILILPNKYNSMRGTRQTSA